jgi:hypothetical protein
MEAHEAPGQEGHGRARGAAVEGTEEEKEVMAGRWGAFAADDGVVTSRVPASQALI